MRWDDQLYHYGIKGQRWGTRRFQNTDGTLTTEGKARYRIGGEHRDESRPKTPRPTDRIKQNKPDIIDRINSIGRSGRRSSQATGSLRATKGVYDRPDGSKDLKRLQKDAKKDAEDMARAKAYYGEGAGNRRKQIRNRISERMKDPDYKAEYDKQLANQDMSKHQKAANRERRTQDAKDRAARIGRGLKNLLLGVGTTSMTAIAIYNAAKMTGADKKIAEFGKKAFKDIANKARSMKKPSVSDYDWHPNNPNKRSSPVSTAPKRDIREKTDRAKHDTQRPWIDDQGNIHYK